MLPFGLNEHHRMESLIGRRAAPRFTIDLGGLTDPFPGAFSFLNGQRYNFLNASMLEISQSFPLVPLLDPLSVMERAPHIRAALLWPSETG